MPSRECDPVLDRWRHLARRRAPPPLVLRPASSASVEDVERWARDCHVRARAVCGSGGLVALSGANGPGLLAAFLGLRRSGWAVLLVDAQTPRNGLVQQAAALGALGVARVLEPWPASASWLEVEALREGPHREAPPETAVLKLSSGSTGGPRAIAVSSEALVADDRQLTATMGIRDHDRILAAVPLTHSYGFSSVALPALLRGTSLVVSSSGHASAVMQVVRQLEVSVLPTVPAFLDGLVKVSKVPPPPASLRLVVSAGAPLSASTARSFRRLFHQPVRAFYGASECGGIAFDRVGAAAEEGTVGTPVEGVSVVLDPVGEACGDREASVAPARDARSGAMEGGDREPLDGVVTVRSAAVALGYFPHPEPTLREGLYRSADLGRWHDGQLQLLGRRDDLINVRGKKVQPGDVERVLRCLPQIVDVAVVGVETPSGSQAIRAVLVSTDPRCDASTVRRFCQARLASHQVPRSILFVDALPRNGRGKLDRTALRALEAEMASRTGRVGRLQGGPGADRGRRDRDPR